MILSKELWCYDVECKSVVPIFDNLYLLFYLECIIIFFGLLTNFSSLFTNIFRFLGFVSICMKTTQPAVWSQIAENILNLRHIKKYLHKPTILFSSIVNHSVDRCILIFPMCFCHNILITLLMLMIEPNLNEFIVVYFQW